MAAPDLGIPARKAALREQILAARASRTEAERAAAGRGISAQAVDRLSTSAVVAAYLAFGSEPPTGELIAGLVAAGVEVVVPVVAGERLDWARSDPVDVAVTGALGIPEPAGPRLGVDYLAHVTAVLVPALAADRSGNRLGRGRGFYDRALADACAPLIAVVYDDELLDAVPVEAHDAPVSAILTPSGWMDVSGR